MSKTTLVRIGNIVLSAILAYIVIWCITNFTPVVWQFFDMETAIKIRMFFEERSGMVKICSVLLSVGYAVIVELLSVIKWKKIEELEKTDPELAREKASHELAKAMLPLLKEARRNRQKAERRERIYQILPEPVRALHEAKNNLLNNPVPKHREKTVLIIAAVVFIVFCVVVLIITHH